MKVIVGSTGARSDIEPAIGFALALRDRGHDVVVATGADRAAMVESWRLPFRPLFDALERAQQFTGATRPAAHAHQTRHVFRRDVVQACAGAEVIVMPAAFTPEVLTLADVLGQPVIVTAALPSLPPSSYTVQAFTAAPPLPLPRGMRNRITHARYDRRISRGTNWADYVEWRTTLGLPTRKTRFIRELLRRQIPQLHFYSTILCPRPPDWPDFVETAGRVAISPARRFGAGMGGLHRDLTGWLDMGPPPVALACNGLPIGETTRYLGLAKAVARKLGVRVVLMLSSTGRPLPESSHDVAVVDEVNEDALFPRCRAVAHNGGGYVTAAAANAGVPSVACYSTADEIFWSERLRSLRIGERVPAANLNASRLIAALARLDRNDVRQRARDIGARMVGEDGTAAAVALVERAFTQAAQLRAQTVRS